MKELTVDTVQGVGDLIWVYQKLAPHCDRLNLNIYCVDKSVIQTRAKDFMQLLPKIGTITYKVVTSPVYDKLAATPWKLSKELLDSSKPFPYACNKLLESGVRLENFDKGLDVDWDLPFNVSSERVFPKKYMVLYVSGSKTDFTWTPERWARFVARIHRQFKRKLPVVLLGAEYDRGPLQAIQSLFMQYGIHGELFIGHDPEKAIRILRDAELFIGYQSGLNIIANNYGTKQIMLYFPFLKAMLNTWCNPGDAEGKIFNAFTFDQDPQKIVNACADVIGMVNKNLEAEAS